MFVAKVAMFASNPILAGRRSRSIDLLLQVGLRTDDRSETAWREWLRRNDQNKITGAERRLLAAFSAKIARIDPDCGHLPRIREIARVLWTRSRLTLTAAAPAFEALDQASIPFIVFKGAAFLSEPHAISAKRMIGDVDLLVSPEAAERAIDALTGGGWASANGESLPYLRQLARVRISCNYCRGEHGRIDLHITPFHYARNDGALDSRLWKEARQVALSGRAVRIPDPTTSAVLSLAHAPMSNSAEWAIDVAARLADNSIDWGKLIDIAVRRDLVLPCRGGLYYLARSIELAVPSHVLEGLDRAPVTVGGRMKYWSNLSDRSDRGIWAKAVNRLADHLLRQFNYTRYVKDRVAITVSRPWLLPPRQGFADLPDQTRARFSREHIIHVPATRRATLMLVFAVPVVSMSRRAFFDVSANGQAIARLRCRLRPSKQSESRYCFLIPLLTANTSELDVSIEARPTCFLPKTASKSAKLEFGAVDFRLERAAIRY